MPSLDAGKQEVVEWVKKHFRKGSTCLDVGACDGKWFDLLGDWLTMDAVEIFAPSIATYGLKEKYRYVFRCDIADLEYEWYDLILFGDVVEHMSVEKAQKVIEYARTRCKDMIISVPFMWHQDTVEGNRWQKHIQDDLTHELFMKRYPGFRELCRPLDNYAYYAKESVDENTQRVSGHDIEKDKPFFSVIIPSHNGEKRIAEMLDSIRGQSFKNYEIIVVCDACTDRTEDIADSYGARVIKTQYMRDGLARNVGIDAATGEWVLFADDDDRFLHEHVFKMLHEVLGKCDENVLNFSYIWKYKGYVQQTPERMDCMAWCRCYRTGFIKKLHFTMKSYGSDVDFFRNMVRLNPKMVWWNTPMYYYNWMRPGSMTERRLAKEQYE